MSAPTVIELSIGTFVERPMLPAEHSLKNFDPKRSDNPGTDQGDNSLRADFVPDTRGLYTGARCELQGGEVIEVKSRRTPLYDLARELEARGYGAAHLQSYTHTGTPSLHGLVKVMAGLTVEEGPSGLRRRKYRPARGGESAVDAQVKLKGTRGQETSDRASTPDRTTGEAA